MLGLGDVRHRELVAGSRRVPFFLRDKDISRRQVDSHRKCGGRKEYPYLSLTVIFFDQVSFFPAQVGVVDGNSVGEKRQQQIPGVRFLKAFEFFYGTGSRAVNRPCP